MLLAGDVGGTKTLLGLFESAPVRPRRVGVRSFATLDYDNLETMIAAFLTDAATTAAAIDTACVGAAGPVIDNAAELTAVPWRVNGRRLADALGGTRVIVLNDLQAMAYSVPVLQESEVHVLQQGTPVPGGNMALIAAGTGLGEALLHHVDGRFVPAASEGGHADFSARTEREMMLVRDLTKRYGRADVEHVVSGRGLIHIHRVLHVTPCVAGVDLDDPNAPAAISAAAFDRRCPGCAETLDLFVEAYGAQAGNLALRSVATGGVFIGGGIAPKILPALTSGAFMRAFRAKAPLEDLLASMPVNVILNAEVGLLGAAVFALGQR
ncbi:MAG: glucokinase [Acidobacteria bacterium]|nr:glucokinase [Acidobacteriota bacterium]